MRSQSASMDQRSVEGLLLRLVERVTESERRYGDALDDLHRRLDRLSETAGDAGAPSGPDSETLARLHRQIDRLGRRLGHEPDESLDDFERLGRTLSEGMASAARSATYHEERDLDRRLVETAQRLERTIGNAMPVEAIEALNARLDEIGGQLSHALRQVPQRETLHQVERQLSEMGRQLIRAERQLAKVGVIENQLVKLIERVDAKPAAPEPQPVDLAQLKEIAQKAAAEAAGRVVREEKQSTVQRLDAMQRDLAAVSDRTRQSNEQLTSKLQAVQETLKRLGEQVERSISSPFAKQRSPFVERPAAEKTEPLIAPLNASVEARADKNGDDVENKLAEDKIAHDKGEGQPHKIDTATSEPELKTPEDLVAAARRGARAAALRGEQLENARIRGVTDVETWAYRKRSLLIIAAAVLLALSAVLLYERLRLKPRVEATPPAAGQTIPAPAAPAGPRVEEKAAPRADSGAALILELERPDAWTPLPTEEGPADGPSNRVGDARGVTDIAKSTHLVSAAPAYSQYAALRPDLMALPPGVVVSLDGASLGGAAMDAARTLPTTLPLPAETLGPLALRQAAAMGDAKAQYAIASRYAHGKGAPRDMTEARRWLERAASAGYAPAQYRLGTLYERGQGVAKDLGRARSWYAAAAEKGNVKAMHNLAIAATASEDQADYRQAARWHEEAASYGFTDSQFNLGILYEHGLGKPKDRVEAYKWFALAALSGDAEAMKQRVRLEEELDDDSLTRAVQAVKNWQAKPPIAEANDMSGKEWRAPRPTPNEELVLRAQALLNRLGYDAGMPDGVAGARTRDAILSFERRNGLEETGEVSIPLVTTLERAAS